MEAFGANFEEDQWESLSRLFTCDDSASDHFLLHCNGSNSFPNHSDSFVVDSDGILDINFHCILQESSNSSTESEAAFLPSPGSVRGIDFLHNVTNDVFFDQSMSFGNGDSFVMPTFPDGMMEEILQLKSGICSDALSNGEAGDSCQEIQAKRQHEPPNSHDNNSSDQSAKKKPRIPRDAQKGKRSSQSKRDKQPIHPSNDEDENINGRGNTQSASTCSSEDDSNVSQELKIGSTSNPKAKTNRGPATDPQSLYARRRRERINERLRILQSLVPNGTKVDISTMLEEAVHYVKFLQLQIKLLSSDDMWMYAPIAYNGMDMGLYQKIVPNLC